MSGKCINDNFLIDNKQIQNIFYYEELDELNILQLDAHAYVHGRFLFYKKISYPISLFEIQLLKLESVLRQSSQCLKITFKKEVSFLHAKDYQLP